MAALGRCAAPPPSGALQRGQGDSLRRQPQAPASGALRLTPEKRKKDAVKKERRGQEGRGQEGQRHLAHRPVEQHLDHVPANAPPPTHTHTHHTHTHTSHTHTPG